MGHRTAGREVGKLAKKPPAFTPEMVTLTMSYTLDGFAPPRLARRLLFQLRAGLVFVRLPRGGPAICLIVSTL